MQYCLKPARLKSKQSKLSRLLNAPGIKTAIIASAGIIGALFAAERKSEAQIQVRFFALIVAIVAIVATAALAVPAATEQAGPVTYAIKPDPVVAAMCAKDAPGMKARFREYRLRLYAKGSFSIFDKEGAKYRAERLLVTIIPIHWPDHARRKLRCNFHARPPATPPPISTAPADLPVEPIFIESFGDGGRSYRIQFYNPGTVATRVEYLVERRDRGQSKWIRHGHSMIVVEPKTTWFQ